MGGGGPGYQVQVLSRDPPPSCLGGGETGHHLHNGSGSCPLFFSVVAGWDSEGLKVQP